MLKIIDFFCSSPSREYKERKREVANRIRGRQARGNVLAQDDKREQINSLEQLREMSIKADRSLERIGSMIGKG